MVDPSAVRAERSDAAALAEVFGRQDEPNLFALRQELAALTPEARYHVLVEDVLPHDEDSIRIAIDFAPPDFPRAADDPAWSTGPLLSPVVDLLNAAIETQQLDDLRQRIAGRADHTAEARKARLALAALVAVAQADEQAATDTFAGPVSFEPFHLWGLAGTFNFGPEGLVVTSQGFDEWKSIGLSSRASFRGDFDVALELAVDHMEPAAEGQESTVFLQVEIDDDRDSAVETKYSISAPGRREAEVQIRRRQRDGSFSYREISTHLFEQAHTLRIARRDGMAYFIFQSEPDSPAVILGRVELGTAPVPSGYLRTLVHTGGADRQTIVRFKKLSIHAEEIIE